MLVVCDLIGSTAKVAKQFKITPSISLFTLPKITVAKTITAHSVFVFMWIAVWGVPTYLSLLTFVGFLK